MANSQNDVMKKLSNDLMTKLPYDQITMTKLSYDQIT